MFHYKVNRKIRHAIVLDHQKGMTIDCLVKTYKVPLAVINRIISTIRPAKILSHEERRNRRVEIIKDFNAGLDLNEIAKKFLISKEYVQQIVKPPQSRMSRKDRSMRRLEILNDYTMGVPIDEICLKYSVCRATVKDAIPILSHEQRAERRKIIADEYNSGASVDELCSKYNVTKVTVYSAITENGYTLRKILSQYSRKDKPNKTLIIVRRMLNGDNSSKIANDMKLSRQYLHQVRKAAIESGFVFPKGA